MENDNRFVNFDDARRRYKLQVEHCNNRKVPILAPSFACFSCGFPIWTAISDEEAKSSLVTCCPRCHASFCE